MKKSIIAVLLSIGMLTLTSNKMNYTIKASVPDDISKPLTRDVSQSEYEDNIKRTKSITLTEFLKTANANTDFIGYIGFSECSHCRSFSSTIKNFTETHNLYYLDIGPNGSFKSSSAGQIQEFFTIFESNNYQFMGTPTVIHVRNNKVISMAVGEDTKLLELEQL